jgi:hypothetical protein
MAIYEKGRNLHGPRSLIRKSRLALFSSRFT